MVVARDAVKNNNHRGGILRLVPGIVEFSSQNKGLARAKFERQCLRGMVCHTINTTKCGKWLSMIKSDSIDAMQ